METEANAGQWTRWAAALKKGSRVYYVGWGTGTITRLWTHSARVRLDPTDRHRGHMELTVYKSTLLPVGTCGLGTGRGD